MNTWLIVLLFIGSLLGCVALGLWIGIACGYKIGSNAMQKVVLDNYTLVPKPAPVPKA